MMQCYHYSVDAYTNLIIYTSYTVLCKIIILSPSEHHSSVLEVHLALSCTVKEIEANLCFAIFGKNSKIQNGRHFWGGKNFLKIACFVIFGKNSKFKMAAIFEKGKFF